MITLGAIFIAGKYGLTFSWVYFGAFILDLVLFSTISEIAKKK